MTLLLALSAGQAAAQPSPSDSTLSHLKRSKLSSMLKDMVSKVDFDTSGRARYDVIPRPLMISNTHRQAFVMSDSTLIGVSADSPALLRDARMLASYMLQEKGVRLTVVPHPVDKGINLVAATGGSQSAEGYRLEVNPDSITISGTPAGIFYGIQTLRKALPAGKSRPVELATVVVEDAPRFGYRGALLDVARHFYTVDEVKQFIDLMALHNLNRFHWHLTDDQGWRIEIKSRPELTRGGAWRSETVGDGVRHGGYYTQDEIRDIVNYAADRYITIVPEIDMPGHMQAALASYPSLGCTGGPYQVWTQWGVSDDVLCAGNDSTLKFIDDVLGEVVRLFPSEYIHIGGDECPKTRWEHCPKCQERIKALGLVADTKSTAEQKLQSFILAHAENFLRQHGRHVIGWDEILEGGLTPDASVMSWRGTEGGIEAARQHHKVVMTPVGHLYFSQSQYDSPEEDPYHTHGYVPLERAYTFNPVPAELDGADSVYVMGAQGCLWGEHIRSFKQAEFQWLPRMAALSEVSWCRNDLKDYDDFLLRLGRLTTHYDSLGYAYSPAFEAIRFSAQPDVKHRRLLVKLSTYDHQTMPYTLKGADLTNATLFFPHAYNGSSIVVKSTSQLRAITHRYNGHDVMFKEDIRFNKATLRPIELRYQPEPKYTFGGAETLIDGLSGKANFNSGRWLGFQSHALDAVIDLKKKQTVGKAVFNSLVKKGDWIFDAARFDVEISVDGKHFSHVATEDYPQLTAVSPDGIYHHSITFTPQQARYVRIVVSPCAKIPEWHQGKGHPAFLFVDELCIE